MNESDISEDEINVPASIKRRRIMSSSSESSDGNFDYDTELSDTENRDGEEVDQVGPSNSIVSKEQLPQNAERPPFPFTAHPGKTFDTPPKKVPLFYLEKFLDEELIKLITKQTNLYAAQFFDNGFLIMVLPSRLVERHFPEQMKTDTGKTKSRKCRVCYKKGVRKESTYWCPDCKAALCINNCFKIYHTEIEF